METEEEIRRRKFQEALTRGLQKPQQPKGPLPSWAPPPPTDNFQVPDELKNIAIGEDYDKSRPGLYRITRNGGNVGISPLLIEREALQRGLQRPFAPGESAGIPDFLRGKTPLAPNTGLTLPQSNAPHIDPTAVPSPATGMEIKPPSPRIGYSTAGLTGVDALQARRKSLEEADPESQVTSTGEILPPEKTGRWKGLGQGALLGAANYDPDRPMYGLGQLIGGAATGAISPRSSAKGMRRFEMGQLDSDIAKGLKLETAQADLDRSRNPVGQHSTRVVTEGEYPGIEAGTEIRVRIDPRTGGVTDVVRPNNKPVIADLAKRPAQGAPHYEKDSDGYLLTVQGGKATRVTDANGKPVQVKKGGNDEEYVEVEVNGRRLRVSPGQALGYYGQVGERETKRDEAQAEREAKLQAAENEYQSLLTEEEKAKIEKERAYQALSDARKNPALAKEDVAQVEEAAKTADKVYQSYAEKKREAQRRISENRITPTSSTSSGRYAGQRFSRAKVHERAKQLGMTPEQAEKEITGNGGTIY